MRFADPEAWLLVRFLGLKLIVSHWVIDHSHSVPNPFIQQSISTPQSNWPAPYSQYPEPTTN